PFFPNLSSHIISAVSLIFHRQSNQLGQNEHENTLHLPVYYATFLKGGDDFVPNYPNHKSGIIYQQHFIGCTKTIH
ncbi:MAG: hypothetical protein IIX65_04115, partial [Lachnospiraceae bacterium]|nr:hypothetical protein [Lachnospiraceae bacterium]